MIILLNDRKLARRLRNNEVSDSARLCYLVLYSFSMTLIGCSFITSTDPLTIYDTILDIVLLASAIAYPLYSYAMNKRGDGSDFVTRYICLNFPIYLQVLLIFFIPMVIAMGLDNPGIMKAGQPDKFYDDFPMLTGPYFLGVSCIMLVYGFWRLGAALLIASGAKE